MVDFGQKVKDSRLGKWLRTDIQAVENKADGRRKEAVTGEDSKGDEFAGNYCFGKGVERGAFTGWYPWGCHGGIRIPPKRNLIFHIKHIAYKGGKKNKRK